MSKPALDRNPLSRRPLASPSEPPLRGGSALSVAEAAVAEGDAVLARRSGARRLAGVQEQSTREPP
jgi:hypothetical protein